MPSARMQPRNPFLASLFFGPFTTISTMAVANAPFAPPRSRGKSPIKVNNILFFFIRTTFNNLKMIMNIVCMDYNGRERKWTCASS